MLDLTIILATRNEEGNIFALQSDIARAFEVYGDLPQLIYVDDSTDSTPTMIRSSEWPYQRLFHREVQDRKGLLSALVLGILHANTSFVAVMDADRQHPAKAVAQMYKKALDGYDYVSGSRYMHGGSSEGLGGTHRKLFSQTLRYSPRVLLGMPLTDPLTNFCLFRKENVNLIQLALLTKPGMMRVQPALLTSGEFKHLVEVPFQFGMRNSGKSNMSFKSGIKFFEEMIWLWHFKNRPRFLDSSELKIA